MPRKPRVLVPAAVYYVYNRISSGEGVLAELLKQTSDEARGR